MNKLSENNPKILHEIFTKLEYLTNVKLFNELALFHDQLSDLINSTLKDNLGVNFYLYKNIIIQVDIIFNLYENNKKN